MSASLCYSASRIPEISDDILGVDNAMKWGFAHELGVFETWDAIGVEESVARMREDGRAIPRNVEKMLAAGHKSFYKVEDGARYYFDFGSGQYKPERQPAGITLLKSLNSRIRR
jgi:3-hydroxyacyl-CoA dehydrogenase